MTNMCVYHISVLLHEICWNNEWKSAVWIMNSEYRTQRRLSVCVFIRSVCESDFYALPAIRISEKEKKCNSTIAASLPNARLAIVSGCCCSFSLLRIFCFFLICRGGGFFPSFVSSGSYHSSFVRPL